MYCDLCGEEIKNGYKVKIDESVLIVCENCKQYADKIISNIEEKRVTQKSKAQTKIVEEEVEIIENFGELIKEKRMELGIDLKTFSKLLNEKESVLKRIEEGKLVPDESLAKKIERLLNIKLYTKIEKISLYKKQKPQITLGDVAELK